MKGDSERASDKRRFNMAMTLVGLDHILPANLPACLPACLPVFVCMCMCMCMCMCKCVCVCVCYVVAFGQRFSILAASPVDGPHRHVHVLARHRKEQVLRRPHKRYAFAMQ
jgi:hypothetical protein